MVKDPARAMRRVNPLFHLSAARGRPSRKAQRSALFGQTSSAQRALVMAEHHARELGLPEIARQIEISRGLLEGAHLEARLALREVAS